MRRRYFDVFLDESPGVVVAPVSGCPLILRSVDPSHRGTLDEVKSGSGGGPGGTEFVSGFELHPTIPRSQSDKSLARMMFDHAPGAAGASKNELTGRTNEAR
jgi:hypothetical protein